MRVRRGQNLLALLCRKSQLKQIHMSERKLLNMKIQVALLRQARCPRQSLRKRNRIRAIQSQYKTARNAVNIHSPRSRRGETTTERKLLTLEPFIRQSNDRRIQNRTRHERSKFCIDTVSIAEHTCGSNNGQGLIDAGRPNSHLVPEFGNSMGRSDW